MPLVSTLGVDCCVIDCWFMFVSLVLVEFWVYNLMRCLATYCRLH